MRLRAVAAAALLLAVWSGCLTACGGHTTSTATFCRALRGSLADPELAKLRTHVSTPTGDRAYLDRLAMDLGQVARQAPASIRPDIERAEHTASEEAAALGGVQGRGVSAAQRAEAQVTALAQQSAAASERLQHNASECRVAVP